MSAAPGMSKLVAASLVGVALLAASACESQRGSFRASPFPDDLSRLPPDQVRASMWVLAAEIQHLESLLEVPGAEERVALRAEVRGSLERMKVAARALDRPGRSTQHPVLNQNLGLFLERIDRARLALDREPPSYFQASTLVGSCYLCHGRGQDIAGQRSPASAGSAAGG